MIPSPVDIGHGIIVNENTFLVYYNITGTKKLQVTKMKLNKKDEYYESKT